jgi:antitoxin (DNA-binding transcriptional repressor) of toxin-antitoxin stability system
MKKVSMYGLKQGLASIIAEVEAGSEITLTRHNRPVARLTRPVIDQLHQGSRFGRAVLKPAVRGKTKGRYLRLLEEDRRAG